MMDVPANMPCGACGCGIYDSDAMTTREAVHVLLTGKPARCKIKALDRDCVGAADLLRTLQPKRGNPSSGGA